MKTGHAFTDAILDLLEKEPIPTEEVTQAFGFIYGIRLGAVMVHNGVTQDDARDWIVELANTAKAAAEGYAQRKIPARKKS